MARTQALKSSPVSVESWPRTPSVLNPHRIRALRDNVWIKREENLSILKYLKFVPDGAKERYVRENTLASGIVVAVGEGEWQNGVLITARLQVGDRVAFGPFAGQDLKLPEDCGHEEYFTIKEKDIRGVIPPKLVGRSASASQIKLSSPTVAKIRRPSRVAK